MSLESVITIEEMVIVSHVDEVGLSFENASGNRSLFFPKGEHVARICYTAHRKVSGGHALHPSLVATEAGSLSSLRVCVACLGYNFREWFIFYAGRFFVASSRKVIIKKS